MRKTTLKELNLKEYPERQMREITLRELYLTGYPERAEEIVKKALESGNESVRGRARNGAKFKAQKLGDKEVILKVTEGNRTFGFIVKVA
jgi:hypothetical protein